MRLAARVALAALLVPSACPARASAADQPPLPPSGISAPPTGKAHASPDGVFRWVEGEGVVTRFLGPGQTRPARLRLPTGPDEGGLRRVLFASGGPYFCVSDEYRSEIGLHLQAVRGQRKARAVIVRSVLKLMDKDGRMLWSRKMPDKNVIGEPGGTQTLRVSRDGTLAILLQDVDPHANPRPILRVLDRKGRERLQLDYTSFKRIDEFVLSQDGSMLVVRGWGMIPDLESWGKMLGFYRTDSRMHWLLPVPKASDQRRLRAVDGSGTACCIDEAGSLVAVSPSGKREALDPERMAERFGPE